MKKLFLAIRHGDIDEVKAILEKKPEVIDEPASPPPKKDKGLSPLQDAIHAIFFAYEGIKPNIEAAEKATSIVRDKIIKVIYRRNSIIPVGDKPFELKKGDRLETELIEGSIDYDAKRRAFMQDFCKKRGLLGK